MTDTQPVKIIEYGGGGDYCRIELDSEETEVYEGVRRELISVMRKDEITDEKTLEYLPGIAAKMWFQKELPPFRHTYKSAAKYVLRVQRRAVRRQMYTRFFTGIGLPFLKDLPFFLPRLIAPLIYIILCLSVMRGMYKSMPIDAAVVSCLMTAFVIAGGIHFSRVYYYRKLHWGPLHSWLWSNVMFMVSALLSIPMWYGVRAAGDGAKDLLLFGLLMFPVLFFVTMVLNSFLFHLIRKRNGVKNPYFKEKTGIMFDVRTQ